MKDPELELSELRAKLKTFFSEVKSLPDKELKERISKLESDIEWMDDPKSIPGEQNYSGSALFMKNRKEQRQAPKLAAAEKVQHALDGFYKKLKQL